MTITNKIQTGKFLTQAEYDELVDRYKNPTIELLPKGITITRTGPGRAGEYLQEVAVEKGLPAMKKGRYGVSAEKEIIAPGDADEWKKP